MGQLVLSTEIQEQDYEPLFILEIKCFQDYPEILAFFPGGLDPTQRSANIKSFKIGVFGGASERACAKISDPRSGDITSFISCRVFREPRGILDDPSMPKTTLPRIVDPKDRAFYEWYWTTLREKMQETKEFQVPHVYIQVIATDPKWQRHGAATMLMNWYVEFARRKGIGRCALCAGPFTSEIGFYEKFGFRRVGVITMVDEERFPGRVGTPQVVMYKDL